MLRSWPETVRVQESTRYLREQMLIQRLAFAAVLISGIFCSRNAKAGDFFVNNTLDSGSGSLREAILNASANGGLNTISCANVSGTITLASPLPPLTGTTTILGPSAGALSLSGNNSFRVLQIDAGATVSISNVALRNGYVTNIGGGAILNAGKLVLVGCTITGNHSISAPGGGIFTRGTLALMSSSVENNVASGQPPSSVLGNLRGMGGGIYVDGGSAIISDCNLVANAASGTSSFQNSPFI